MTSSHVRRRCTFIDYRVMAERETALIMSFHASAPTPIESPEYHPLATVEEKRWREVTPTTGDLHRVAAYMCVRASRVGCIATRWRKRSDRVSQIRGMISRAEPFQRSHPDALPQFGSTPEACLIRRRTARAFVLFPTKPGDRHGGPELPEELFKNPVDRFAGPHALRFSPVRWRRCSSPSRRAAY